MHFLSKFMTKILKFFFKRSKTKHLLTSSISMQCHISKIGYHVWTVKIIEPVGGLKVMKTLLKETTMQLDFISKLICCLGRSPIHIYCQDYDWEHSKASCVRHRPVGGKAKWPCATSAKNRLAITNVMSLAYWSPFGSTFLAYL